MQTRQRIAIVGDFHLDASDATLTVAAMEDIKNEKPDLLVALGDFGPGGVIGTPEGIRMAWEHLSRTGAPIRPILGNHDLQNESAQKLEPGTMEKTLCDIAGLDASYGILEFDDYRFLFVTTEYQPEETCWQVQECYVSDEQFHSLRDELAQRPGVPVIVFSHAPPIGSRLKTFPDTHPRATNAYLEQNHDPFRWLELYRNTPEIVLWFSAHYHLGHDHPDSHTEQFGTHFFHTQVHQNVTRDGTRQTRLVEIAKDHIGVFTLDHIQRQKRAVADWEFTGGLQALVAAKTGRHPEESKSFLPIAIDNTPINQVLPIPGQRLLVYTERHYLWEVDLPTGALMGTHHLGCALDALVLSGNNVWRAWDCFLAVSDLTSLKRFMRFGHEKPESRIGWTFTEPIKDLQASENGRIWVLTSSALWEVDAAQSEPTLLYKAPAQELAHLSCIEGGPLITTSGGTVLHLPSSR